DLAGLEVAYQAYLNSLGGEPAPELEGFSGQQRFFIAFAQAWRNKARDEPLRGQVVGGVHSPGRWRAQTVRNIDGWYEAFAARPGQDLFRATAERVRAW